MTATYATSRTGSSKALSTYARPYQPQKAYATYTLPTYTRPADWISVPTPTAGSKVFYLLCAVWNDTSNFMALSATGSAGYTVDWGDGSSAVNVATGVQANYNYSYSTVSSSVTSRGYKTVLITVTPQSSGTLTGLNINLRNTTNTNAGTGISAASSPVLEIAICSADLTSLTMGSGTPNVRLVYCEKVTIVETGTITSMASLFNNFQALQSLTLPAAFGTSTTDMSSMFGNNYKLAAAPTLVTSSVTTMNNMFQGCNNLLYVPDYNTSSVTGMGSMFSECRSLVSAPNLDTGAVTNFGSMYLNCSSLVNVPTIRAAATITTFANMFSGCASLKTVNISHTSTATSIDASSMFQNCYSLINAPNLDYSKFRVILNMYNSCYSIISFPNKVFNFTGVSSTTGNGQATFANCYSLKSIDTIISNNFVGINLFQNCPSLVSIGTISGSMYLSSTFSGCYSLVSLPAITNAAATPSGAFSNCTSLETVSIDFSPITNQGLPTTFQGCYKLKNITFTNLTISGASAMNSTFQDCRSLEVAPTFPSTSGVTNWTSMFNGCYNLRVAPSFNMTSGTTMNTMFQNCYSLQTVPAYTFSSVSAVNVTGMFQNCYSLENIGTQTYTSSTLTTSGSTFTSCPNLSSLRSSALKVSINFINSKFSGTQLDQIYTDLPTVTAQTITVTGNWGTTSDTPTIATAKGWTVTGS